MFPLPATNFILNCTEVSYTRGGGGGGEGVLPSKSWMASHFHNLTDYNEVTFLVELLEWGRKFSGLLG